MSKSNDQSGATSGSDVVSEAKIFSLREFSALDNRGSHKRYSASLMSETAIYPSDRPAKDIDPKNGNNPPEECYAEVFSAFLVRAK